MSEPIDATAPDSARGWNFADLWEVIAGQLGDALAQQQGDRQNFMGGNEPPRQRRRPGAARHSQRRQSRTRSRSTSTTVRSTSSRRSRRSRPASPPSTPTTDTQRTNSSTSGTTETSLRSCSTAPSSTRSKRFATEYLGSPHGCGLTIPPGPALTGQRRTRPRQHRVLTPTLLGRGAVPAITSCSCTPVGPRGCRKA